MSGTGVVTVNTSHPSPAQSLHHPGREVINTQLNEEPLDYNCKRDDFERKVQIGDK